MVHHMFPSPDPPTLITISSNPRRKLDLNLPARAQARKLPPPLLDSELSSMTPTPPTKRPKPQ